MHFLSATARAPSIVSLVSPGMKVAPAPLHLAALIRGVCHAFPADRIQHHGVCGFMPCVWFVFSVKIKIVWSVRGDCWGANSIPLISKSMKAPHLYICTSIRCVTDGTQSTSQLWYICKYLENVSDRECHRRDAEHRSAMVHVYLENVSQRDCDGRDAGALLNGTSVHTSKTSLRKSVVTDGTQNHFSWTKHQQPETHHQDASSLQQVLVSKK